MNLDLLPNAFFVLCAGIFGAAAGSFFHVCVWRIPHEQSIVTPGSHCPFCDTPIRWFDNIPIFSYVFLGGSCRVCKHPIPIRYLIYELLTALLYMGVVYKFGPTPTAFLYLVLVSDLVIASGVDWDHQYIPDFLSLPMIPLSLVIALSVQWTPWFSQALTRNVWEALLGLGVGGGAIWGIRILGGWVFRQEAMGFGDVKLMAFLGGFLGWEMALLCIFLAAFFGSCVGIGLKWVGKIEKYGRIPFGPYLALGAYLCLLFGPQIIQWYTEPFQFFNRFNL